MIIDFTKENYVISNFLQENWQQEIINFLDLWNSESTILNILTSGSTGEPKLIEVEKKAMKQSALATGEYFNLLKCDSALLCLPINYIAGKMMLVRAKVLKLKLICIKPIQNIEINEKIDFVAVTPMQINQSINSLNYFKKVIIGGSKLEENTKLKLLQIKGTEFFETYGMTETVSHVAVKNISSKEDYFRTLPTISFFIDERECLVLKVPYVSNVPIVTNDIIEKIDETSFKLIGRIDNIINSGGIKISPEIVEDKIKEYLDINFIISSKRDEILGEKVVLILEGEENGKLIENLQNNLKKVLSKFEMPKEIFFVKKFPKTKNGKIIRKELKK